MTLIEIEPSAPPLSRLATLPDGVPELTLGHEAAAWAHENLIQPNGPRAGEPFELTYDQWRFLLWWYALDEDGRWIFNHGVRRLAKGSGKSPFAAVMCLIEFLAPVRLWDWDRFADGGCRGRPVEMPLVQIAATAEKQTANTMRMVRAFAPRNGDLADRYNLDVGKTQYYRIPEGTLEVITSSSTAAEGAEASFIVADETEHWTPSNGGPELAATLGDNLAKSGNRMLETSNAWVPGVGSVAEASWDAWIAQEEGRTKGHGAMLYDARMAPPDTDMADPDSLRHALRFVYADCDWKREDPDDEDSPIDVEPIVSRIYLPNAEESASRRKYLNLPTVADDAWTTPEEWELLRLDPRPEVGEGESIVLFFDGSKSGDATSLTACRVDDGLVFQVGLWEPQDEEEVDYADVDRMVGFAHDYWDVRAFFGDVREWESFVKISWPEAYADGYDIMAVPSGKSPQSIAWDMRTHTFQFTAETELVLAEIEEGEFRHCGHPGLARHVGNARRKANRYGVTIGKESPGSSKKIDAAVTMIGARMVRRLLLAAPQKGKQPGEVHGFN